jgi:uncharacterized protein YndB with AHSA1/START domain
MSELYGALTRTDDDYAVHFERDYPTAPQDLWSAVTEPDRVARWLAPVEGDLRPGGAFVVHFDDDDAHFVVDTCEAPRTLTVRWQGRTGSTLVRVSVLPLGEQRSRLVLVHERLSGTQAPEYAGGWHWHLDTLDGFLSDREVERTDWDELARHYRDGLQDVPTATY